MPIRTNGPDVRDILSSMALIDTSQEPAGGPLVAFRYTSYRLFWIGNAFSNIGIWAGVAVALGATSLTILAMRGRGAHNLEEPAVQK